MDNKMMEDNQNEITAAMEDNSKEDKKAFSEAVLVRKVKCRTFEGQIVEVPLHLMMQSKTFMNIWETMGMEEEFDPEEENAEPFIFPLGEITGICFGKIVKWMEEHKGQPEVEVKMDQYNAQREWFELTAWEKDFFDIDFETLKEYFIAANFLGLKSLFIYCSQECARAIMDKDAEEVKEMLSLPEEISEADQALTNYVLENCHFIDFDINMP